MSLPLDLYKQNEEDLNYFKKNAHSVVNKLKYPGFTRFFSEKENRGLGKITTIKIISSEIIVGTSLGFVVNLKKMVSEERSDETKVHKVKELIPIFKILDKPLTSIDSINEEILLLGYKSGEVIVYNHKTKKRLFKKILLDGPISCVKLFLTEEETLFYVGYGNVKNSCLIEFYSKKMSKFQRFMMKEKLKATMLISDSEYFLIKKIYKVNCKSKDGEGRVLLMVVVTEIAVIIYTLKPVFAKVKVISSDENTGTPLFHYFYEREKENLNFCIAYEKELHFFFVPIVKDPRKTNGYQLEGIFKKFFYETKFITKGEEKIDSFYFIDSYVVVMMIEKKICIVDLLTQKVLEEIKIFPVDGNLADCNFTYDYSCKEVGIFDTKTFYNLIIGFRDFEQRIKIMEKGARHKERIKLIFEKIKEIRKNYGKKNLGKREERLIKKLETEMTISMDFYFNVLRTKKKTQNYVLSEEKIHSLVKMLFSFYLELGKVECIFVDVFIETSKIDCQSIFYEVLMEFLITQRITVITGKIFERVIQYILNTSTEGKNKVINKYVNFSVTPINPRYHDEDYEKDLRELEEWNKKILFLDKLIISLDPKIFSTEAAFNRFSKMFEKYQLVNSLIYIYTKIKNDNLTPINNLVNQLQRDSINDESDFKRRKKRTSRIICDFISKELTKNIGGSSTSEDGYLDIESTTGTYVDLENLPTENLGRIDNNNTGNSLEKKKIVKSGLEKEVQDLLIMKQKMIIFIFDINYKKLYDTLDRKCFFGLIDNILTMHSSPFHLPFSSHKNEEKKKFENSDNEDDEEKIEVLSQEELEMKLKKKIHLTLPKEGSGEKNHSLNPDNPITEKDFKNKEDMSKKILYRLILFFPLTNKIKLFSMKKDLIIYYSFVFKLLVKIMDKFEVSVSEEFLDFIFRFFKLYGDRVFLPHDKDSKFTFEKNIKNILKDRFSIFRKFILNPSIPYSNDYDIDKPKKKIKSRHVLNALSYFEDSDFYFVQKFLFKLSKNWEKVFMCYLNMDHLREKQKIFEFIFKEFCFILNGKYEKKKYYNHHYVMKKIEDFINRIKNNFTKIMNIDFEKSCFLIFFFFAPRANEYEMKKKKKDNNTTKNNTIQEIKNKSKHKRGVSMKQQIKKILFKKVIVKKKKQTFNEEKSLKKEEEEEEEESNIGEEENEEKDFPEEEREGIEIIIQSDFYQFNDLIKILNSQKEYKRLYQLFKILVLRNEKEEFFEKFLVYLKFLNLDFREKFYVKLPSLTLNNRNYRKIKLKLPKYFISQYFELKCMMGDSDVFNYLTKSQELGDLDFIKCGEICERYNIIDGYFLCLIHLRKSDQLIDGLMEMLEKLNVELLKFCEKDESEEDDNFSKINNFNLHEGYDLNTLINGCKVLEVPNYIKISEMLTRILEIIDGKIRENVLEGEFVEKLIFKLLDFFEKELKLLRHSLQIHDEILEKGLIGKEKYDRIESIEKIDKSSLLLYDNVKDSFFKKRNKYFRGRIVEDRSRDIFSDRYVQNLYSSINRKINLTMQLYHSSFFELVFRELTKFMDKGEIIKKTIRKYKNEKFGYLRKSFIKIFNEFEYEIFGHQNVNRYLVNDNFRVFRTEFHRGCMLKGILSKNENCFICKKSCRHYFGKNDIDEVIVWNCGHAFHRSCIRKYECSECFVCLAKEKTINTHGIATSRQVIELFQNYLNRLDKKREKEEERIAKMKKWEQKEIMLEKLEKDRPERERKAKLLQKREKIIKNTLQMVNQTKYLYSDEIDEINRIEEEKKKKEEEEEKKKKKKKKSDNEDEFLWI